MPVSIGVAILKYRLYEIDQIICDDLAGVVPQACGMPAAAYPGD